MLTEIKQGNCLEVLKTLPENSISAIVTDPPYGLSFLNEKWDKSTPSVACFQAMIRVLRPGGHLLAFSSSKTYHRLACAVEDAGFEIRDQIMWIYGSGQASSRDVSKAIDKKAGVTQPVIGYRKNNPKDKKIYVDNTQTGFAPGRCKKGNTKGLKSKEITAPVTEDAKRWHDWRPALKPAHEPIVLARKPLAETPICENVLKHEAGVLNIKETRIGEHKRYPTNVLHSGVLDKPFFYCAKATKKDRGEGNTHPTVKPTELMRYLCRLITPKGGVILDPFAGSGSTLKAARLEGFSAIGIELSEEYTQIAKNRLQSSK